MSEAVSQQRSSYDTSKSPFASVIGTNHTPSATELKEIKALLVDPLLESSQMEAEITRVQNLIDQIVSKKWNVDNYIGAHRTLISPIRQIPPETLAEIFVYCLPTDSQGFAVRDLKQAPLVLTVVCRDWRSIALSTPRLWNSLHVFVPLDQDISEKTLSRRIAGVNLWLERSGSLPLSISLHGCIDSMRLGVWPLPQHLQANFGPPPTHQHIRTMAQSLMEYSGRFQHLSLGISIAALSFFVEVSPPLFPALTSLQVCHEDFDDALPSSFASFLTRMPALDRLVLSSLRVRDYPVVIGVNMMPDTWARLSSITVQNSMLPSHILAVLARTPLVQSISFKIGWGAHNAFSSDSWQTVHLPNLRDVHLTMVRLSPAIAEFFPAAKAELISMVRCLQYNALETLHLVTRGLGVHSEWIFSGLPLDTLKVLKLDLGLTPDALTDCLSHTPGLVTLHCMFRPDHPGIEDSHLRALTRSEENPTPWCPLLENLSILPLKHKILPPEEEVFYFRGDEEGEGENSEDSFTTGALIKLLQSRISSSEGAGLKICKVGFLNAPSLSDEEQDTLRDMRKRMSCLQLQGRRRVAESQIEPRNDAPTTGLWPAYSISPVDLIPYTVDFV